MFHFRAYARRYLGMIQFRFNHRFDLRQFLYNVRWPWQFRRIDELAAKTEAKR